MGRLTTHVLDTMRGVPAAGLKIQLFRLEDDRRVLIRETTTNIDGRCDAPLLAADAMTTARHELLFHVGDYFAAREGVAQPPFLDQVPVRFAMADPTRHYHVPLLVTPWGYSTYRGS